MLGHLILPLILLIPFQGNQAQKLPGQRPLLIVGDQFQFTPGSWASYRIEDKKKNEPYRMRISILERDKKKRPAASWMEIAVESRGNPTVVTRLLAEETPQGPGKIHQVIVQAEGYSPFNVPKKYFQGKNAEVNAPIPVQVLQKLERRTVTIGKRAVQAWDVEARDQSGERTRAIVSEEVLPIGIVEAENSDIKMSLADWGLDARTQIKGRPRAFSIWILEQLMNGLGKSK
jgi:hypothetical protein